MVLEARRGLECQFFVAKLGRSAFCSHPCYFRQILPGVGQGHRERPQREDRRHR